MSTRPATAAPQMLRPKEGPALLWFNFKRSWVLHLILVLPMIIFILFEAMPLYGLQVVFRQYRTKAGLIDSEWIGLANFQKFFVNYKWTSYIVNTITISVYSIFAGFPVPIILALLLHVNERKTLKKLTQNFSYIPHFVSTVVMVGLINQIFDPLTGIVSILCRFIDVPYLTDLSKAEASFRHVFVWSGVWQNMGWSTIMYVAALSGVSMELHEAAKIDGASRWRRVLMVDLPAIAPTIAIMLILRFGSIMSVGYEKAYLMQNALNMGKSELISTYVYKEGLQNNQPGFGSAVGLMNSVINSGMVILVNKIANWLSDGEAGLF